MNSTTVKRGAWYPDMPPALPGETNDAYTNRLTGADRTSQRPYNHPRNRQCSIGYHDECSDPTGRVCKCPHHTDIAPPAGLITPAITNAAITLADLYYLPVETTASRIMLEANALIRTDEVHDKAALRDRINALYNTTISDGFVIDVMAILDSKSGAAK